MRFTCEKSLLVSALSTASRTVAQKSTLQVLEGIHCKAGHGLYLTGYNMETGITVHVQADVVEDGECIFPSRLFSEIVRRLPEGPVTVVVDESYKVSIRADYSSFTISASDPDDYPELPDVESNKGVHIPQSKLRELISGTLFSVSENQSRPIHTGCLFEVENDSISMVALDGYRLARRTWHAPEPIGRTMKFVVPAAALKEVEKILADSQEDAVFTLGPKHILFEIGEATLVCRLLEGEFLNWRQVVPTDSPVKLVVKVSRLAASFERVGLIVSEKVKSPVRCTFGKNEAYFVTNTPIGSAEDRCDLAGDGQGLEIGFNYRYILDALRAAPGEEVTLEMRDGLSPLVITPASEEQDFAYMVLPVRLKNY